MATVSPGIYVREFDFSEYVAQLGSSTLALLGGATKGPLNEPTLVTNEGDLVRLFGPPVSNDYGLQTAVQFLKRGSRVLFTRVADDDAVAGVKTADAKFYGGVRASGTISFSAKPVDGDTIAIAPGNPILALENNATGTAGNKPILVAGASAASMIAVGLSGGTVSAKATGSIRFDDSVNPADGTKFVVPSSLGERTFEIDDDVSDGAHAAASFSGQPADADQIVLNDGVNPAITFEFDSNSSVVETSVLKQVVIGADLASTLANFAAKVNLTTSGTFTISSEVLTAGRIDFFDSSSAGAEVISKVDAGGVVTLKAFADNIVVTRGLTAAATMAALVSAINTASFGITATDLTGAVVFEFDDDSSVAGTNVPVPLGDGTVTMFTVMQSLVAAINANAVFGDLSISATDSSVTTPSCVLVASSTGDQYNSAIVVTQTGTAIAATGLAGGIDSGAQHLVTFHAVNPGSWGNSVIVQVVEYRAPGVPATAATVRRSVLVSAAVEPGATPTVVEVFADVSLDPASDRYIETMLLRGITGEVGASEYIRADVYPAGAVSSVPTGILDPATVQLGRGDLGNTIGQDGITGLRGANGFSFFVGTVNGSASTGLQALRNPETTEFNLLAVPGISHRSVISAGLTLCRNRGDALYLIDPPLGLTVDEVVAWHNGLGSTGTGGDDPTAPGAALDDSYGAMFWPWLEIDDPYTKKTLWLPPSGFVASAMSVVDDNQGPWWAVAGFVRGKLSANRSEYSPTREERDLLVGGTNRVNPIVNFQGKGLTIYGNRTLQRRATALNSLHVRRMLLYAEKICATAVQVLQFNPNDEVTWRDFTRLCSDQLDRIKAGRGLEDFKVICDASTNPPALRQNKTMRGKLLLKPIEAAEIILLDFAIFASGATFDESRL